MSFCQAVGHSGCLFPLSGRKRLFSEAFKRWIALWSLIQKPEWTQRRKHHTPQSTTLQAIPPDLLANMKEAIVNKEIKVEIKDVAVPKPGPDEVLIKVVVAGSLPVLPLAR